MGICFHSMNHSSCTEHEELLGSMPSDESNSTTAFVPICLVQRVQREGFG